MTISCKMALIFTFLIFMITLSGCRNDTIDAVRIKQDGVWIYTVDYTKKYQDTLNAMFENKWTVQSIEEKYEAVEEICSHVDSTPMRFTEWKIEFRDGNGELQEFVLNNRETLSQQIEDYITNYIPQYYKEHFYHEYLKEVPLAGASYVFGFLTDVSVNPQLEENKVRVEMTEKYRKNLETPEGTICFSKFTPANAFGMCPVYLSIHISIDDGGYEDLKKQALEEYTKNQVEGMIDSMNEFAKNQINAEITVVSNQEIDRLYDGEKYWRWQLLKGNAINVGPFDFEKYVYDRYIGECWS